jgi:sulfite dehydrogenase (cytochrome) subunit A
MKAHARRRFLQALSAAGLGLPLGCDRAEKAHVAAVGPGFPGKVADLIIHTDRPPNLETPLRYFVHDLTPNDAFFARWHLSGLPLGVDAATYRFALEGHVEKKLELSLAELKARFEPAEVVAVNQCSGNSRREFEPRVTGVQWGRGAIGNARWRGVRLADVLAWAGVRPGAVEVSFRGMDRAALPSVAEFEKSLELDRARDRDVLLAYEMNGEPLPILNGFPLRLVVPGVYSTYWVKAIDRITVHAAPFEGFWMKKAYRVAKTENADERPDALAKETTPIGKMNVKSMLVRPAPGDRVVAGKATEIEGVAFDGGSGIAKVEVSTDGGATFREARLDQDLGPYSFRRFRAPWTPDSPGARTVIVRATSVAGETQRPTPGWNRAGYMRNAAERADITVVAS